MAKSKFNEGGTTAFIAPCITVDPGLNHTLQDTCQISSNASTPAKIIPRGIIISSQRRAARLSCALKGSK